MNNLCLWVVRHVKRILVSAGLVVLSDILLCWIGYSKTGVPHSITRALETTGGFLMTLTSPDSLHPATTELLIARCVGWIVSFIGWLTLPLLFAVTLSRSQNIEHEIRELQFALLQQAEKSNLSQGDSSALVSDKMAKSQVIPPEAKPDA